MQKNIKWLIAMLLAIAVCFAMASCDLIFGSGDHTHTEVIDEAVEATCTTEGKTEGKHCSECNEVIVAQQTVPAKGHTEVVDEAVEATCTTEGKTEGKHCSVCNEVIVAQQTVPANGHTEAVDAAVDATCTTAGKTEGKHCSVCNEVIVAQQTVPAKGHTEAVDKAVAPTCTVDGKTEGKHCSDCNEVLVAQQTVPANGHTEAVDAAVEATCTATGKTEGKHCSVCNDVLVAQQIVPAKGHTEVVDAAVEATCTATGLTEGKHCSVCKTVIVEQTEVPVKNHIYDNKYDAFCNVCNFEREAECAHTNAITLPAVDATCTTSGLTAGFKCANEKCGEILVEQSVIEALGHSWIDATCTTAKTCSVCQATEGEIPGHNEVIDKAVEATCTADGKTEGKHCSECNEVLVAQQTIPAKGHSHSTEWSSNASQHWHECSCGDKADAANHTYDNDCDASCNECGYTRTVAGHVYDNACDADCNVCGTERTVGDHVYDNACDADCNVCGATRTITHSYTAEDVKDDALKSEANCTDGAVYFKSCDVCGKISNDVNDTFIGSDALGHDWQTDGSCAKGCTVKIGFEFGEAITGKTHADGALANEYTETNGEYTLTLSDMANIYSGAFDNVGNSCLKLGTSSKLASFSFTVGEDITKVYIYVAGYKANKAKVSINGGEVIEISTYSNDGEYTVIEVDTSKEKTVSFTTVSGGVRCMINAIEFAYSITHEHVFENGACVHCGLAEVHEHKYNATVVDPTCTADGYTTYTCSCGNTYTANELPKTGHTDTDGDFFCNNVNGDAICGEVIIPAAGSSLTIAQANKLAHAMGNSYTAEKFIIVGKIVSIANTQYGNMTIEDENGDSIYVYGLYSAETGKIRYDAFVNAPKVGDTITIQTVLGCYNGSPQAKSAWLAEHDGTEVSCESDSVCTICGVTLASKLDCVDENKDGKCDVCGNAMAAPPVAIFEFGNDKGSAHGDGTEATFNSLYKTCTVNGYTLTFTASSKVYGGAFDAMGNTCLKLGTGSATASFTIDVPSNVTKVVIYVAGYKANSASVKVNGVTYSVTESSNNGLYKAIEIDTTEVKTIEFATNSSPDKRCMINAIEFYGNGEGGDAPVIPEEPVCESEKCEECGGCLNADCKICESVCEGHDASDGPTYVKVTSADQFTTGTYVIVIDGYVLTKYNSGWVEVDNSISPENPKGTVWTLTVDGSTVTIKDSNGEFIQPSSDSSNGIKAGEYDWTWSFNDGKFQFTGYDGKVMLAANKQSSYKLRAYKKATADTYPNSFEIYKLAEN